MNVFAYGTLKNQGFVERMLGHEVEMQSGFLSNYVRLKPNFYMIFPHEGRSVKGVIIYDLSEEDIARFDRYEGNGFGYYDRMPVMVEPVGGPGRVDCQAYVGGPNMTWFYDAWIANQAPDH